MTGTHDDPRSRLFPPLFMIVGVLLGLGVQRLRPLLFAPRPAGRWIGGALMGVGLALGLWAVLSFRWARTTTDPHGDVTAFVTSGPFRFSRNPMYLTNVVFQIGAALLLDNAWILLLVPVTWVLLDRVVIAGEERYLTNKYGRTYDEYRRKVRRWL